MIGGVADEEEFVRGLDSLYQSKKLRESFTTSGLERVREERFRWENVGQAFADAVADTLGLKKCDVTTYSDKDRQFVYAKPVPAQLPEVLQSRLAAPGASDKGSEVVTDSPSPSALLEAVEGVPC